MAGLVPDAVERGSMSSSRRPAASAPPARCGGLALPTTIAALVCGGSVFAIAATGALALRPADPVTVSMSRLDALSVRSAPVSGPLSGSLSGPISSPISGPAGAAASAAGPGAASGVPVPGAGPGSADPEPAVASTGVQYSIAVHGPGYDRPAEPSASGADRGSLTAPRVVAAAEPTVVLLGYGPTSGPTPSGSAPGAGPTAAPATAASAVADATAAIPATSAARVGATAPAAIPSPPPEAVVRQPGSPSVTAAPSSVTAAP